ncbi:MAG: transglutaminase domain-containing protein [Flavobacteriales bacterium]
MKRALKSLLILTIVGASVFFIAKQLGITYSDVKDYSFALWNMNSDENQQVESPNLMVYETESSETIDFSAVDKHAKSCPPSKEEDLDKLAWYLAQGASTDLEKTRSIYVWLVDNISYDFDQLEDASRRNKTAAEVLRDKTCICGGYANLFLDLGEKMDLPIRRVTGYSKGMGYESAADLEKSRHAWNQVLIDGEWRTFDATWGCIEQDGLWDRLTKRSMINEAWFNTDPYLAIFTHYPLSEEFFQVSPVPSKNQFTSLPRFPFAFDQIIGKPKDFYQKCLTGEPVNFPETYHVDFEYTLMDAPMDRIQNNGERLFFKIYAPSVHEMALKDPKGKFKSSISKDGYFEDFTYPEGRGELLVLFKKREEDEEYSMLLVYQIQ